MTPSEAKKLLERSGAMLTGHFRLTSGRHSDVYFQKARILEHPDVSMEFAREIASWYPKIDVVVSPAIGAIPLGFAVAQVAGARSIFAEREQGQMRLRRGFWLERDERTLVVEDVVTTGGSAGDVFALVKEAAADPLGVAALIDRSTAPLNFPMRAVLKVEASTWEADECPLCKRGVVVTSPGSRHLTMDRPT